MNSKLYKDIFDKPAELVEFEMVFPAKEDMQFKVLGYDPINKSITGEIWFKEKRIGPAVIYLDASVDGQEGTE